MNHQIEAGGGRSLGGRPSRSSLARGSCQIAAQIKAAHLELIEELRVQSNCLSLGVLIRQSLVAWAESRPQVDPVLAHGLRVALLDEMRGRRGASPTTPGEA